MTLVVGTLVNETRQFLYTKIHTHLLIREYPANLITAMWLLWKNMMSYYPLKP